MRSKISKQTENLIGNLYNDGALKRAELSTFRSSVSVNDSRAVKIYPLLFSFLSRDQLSANGTPSYSENALFLTAKLYAIYQRGSEAPVFAKNDENESDMAGVNFFSALGKLRASLDTESKNFSKRVANILQATSFDFVQNSLPQLVKILKQNLPDQKIAWGALAYDLYQMQFDYESAKKVILRWGQDFYSSNL